MKKSGLWLVPSATPSRVVSGSQRVPGWDAPEQKHLQLRGRAVAGSCPQRHSSRHKEGLYWPLEPWSGCGGPRLSSCVFPWSRDQYPAGASLGGSSEPESPSKPFSHHQNQVALGARGGGRWLLGHMACRHVRNEGFVHVCGLGGCVCVCIGVVNVCTCVCCGRVHVIWEGFVFM